MLYLHWIGNDIIRISSKLLTVYNNKLKSLKFSYYDLPHTPKTF